MTDEKQPLAQRILDNSFGLIAVLYIGIVMICWTFGDFDGRDRDYVAARKLFKNHRIVSQDLRRPDTRMGSLGFYMTQMGSLVGKYVTNDIEPKKDISVDALGNQPDMKLPQGSTAIAFLLPTGSDLIGLLDVNSLVALVGQDPDPKSAVSIPAKVHAIICERTKDGSNNCYPILEIPMDQSQMITKNLGAFHLVLR